jgi:hypothetical protein
VSNRAASTQKPKRLTSKRDREMARHLRNAQWAFMEKVNVFGTVWFCVWNKYRRAELADETRCCLISGMELLEWIDRHPDWWVKGEWSDERYAMPLQLTDAGRLALQQREKYDMEPVTGGLVEPGWLTTPSSP